MYACVCMCIRVNVRVCVSARVRVCTTIHAHKPEISELKPGFFTRLQNGGGNMESGTRLTILGMLAYRFATNNVDFPTFISMSTSHRLSLSS